MTSASEATAEAVLAAWQLLSLWSVLKVAAPPAATPAAASALVSAKTTGEALTNIS
jgi:hypothetical protein